MLNSVRRPACQVALVLLDERYERDPLPCEVRADWCRRVVLAARRRHPSEAWCKDFLLTGGASGTTGSCCKAEGEMFYGWCLEVGGVGGWRREMPS